MTEYKTTDFLKMYVRKYNMFKRAFWILFIISTLAITFFGTMAIVNGAKYQMALEEGAKNTVQALELVVACKKAGNVTYEQITREYINTFILNKSIQHNQTLYKPYEITTIYSNSSIECANVPKGDWTLGASR